MPAPDAMVLSQRSDGRILEVNASFEKITGWSREHIIGRHSPDLGLWSDGKPRQEMLQRLDRDGRVRDLEIQFSREEGNYRGRFSIDPLESDGEHCLLTVFQLEALSSDSEPFTPVPFEELGLPAFCLDSKGHLVSWSRGAHELLGDGLKKALGHSVSDFLVGVEFEDLRRDLQHIGEQRTELVLRDAHGELHEAMGWWTLEQGDEERWVLFTRQLTELKP